MNRTINKLKLIFLGVFGFATVGVVAYHLFWVWPGDRCEAARKWWDPQTRTCAQPVLISDITGRIIDDPEALAAAKKAVGRE